MPTNFPLTSSNPMAGFLGFRTASFYQLDPTGTTPVELIADIVPAFTPFRVALSMVESENYVQNFRVTTNPLQDFTDTTPNVHAELVELTIAGVFSSAPPMSMVGLPPPPTFGFRIDLLQMSNLERMSNKRRPIMVVTPRVSLATCFIQSVNRIWTPDDGANTPVVIHVREARLASPFNVEALPDTDALAAGDSQTTGGGEMGTTPVDTPASSPPATQQLAPDIHPAQAGW